ncbi:variant surface glycoprotein 3275 [Trypanosoma rangeli]|uniref:Variant surface glycoprotein 3275 n=1 Tax=Trypanosoma rangeli TaxID=5698 RepID=A0A422NAP0_TRYRA|nr:variant surface glycoprotein 3275 [Trypanosoma rangeli]RNF02547.1 variant surface glycoprotein 3275 [Trypanosoma rangeli]|eukprot:RNF02547.1 variant surface glycoprotein 3275 [Trypanosoma rangeli]
MALLYPTLEEQATLVHFATHLVGCSAEDVELLGATCAALLVDTDVVNEFIFRTFPAALHEAAPQPQTKPNVALPTANYCRGGIPLVLVPYSDAPLPERALIYNTEEVFRPHEAALRALQLRLRRGRAAMAQLNEKHNYAFTVVTVGKRGEEVDGKEATVLTGTKVGVQAVSAGEETQKDSGDTPPAANGGAEECGRGGRCVCMAFMLFLQTFDAFLAWVSSLMEILDGEGTAPAVGTYHVHDQSERENTRDGDESHTGGEQHGQVEGNSGALSASQIDAAAPRKESLQEAGQGSAAAPTSSARQESATLPRRSHTVRVTRYELHDVNSIFQVLQNQASLFFLPEYTSYDPRLQRRLLSPEYYGALRETIHNISQEVERLRQLGASLTKARSNGAIIIFCPAICNFCFLRDTLKLYWSACVTDDDITSLQYHRMQYNKCVLEVGEVLEMLKQLRRPPVRVATESSGVGSSSSSSNINNNISCGTPTPAPSSFSSSKEWVITPEERGAIEAGFTSFWSIRARVFELSDSLSRDIEEKNRTHRCQMPAPQSPSATAATNVVATGNGFTQWMMSTVRNWKQLVTCGVELPEDSSSLTCDSRGWHRFKHSPRYEQKAELQRLVQRLVKAVEAQATILERDYPGAFYRDVKSKWARRAGGVIRYLESMSIVFSPPA